MTIPPRFLAALRDRLTLSEIIGRKVKLTRAGREFKGCCPFHNEKTPSFYVNDDKQFYHCFGCSAHGDAVGFVMQHDNLSFIDAVEMLAAEAGMQVPKQTPQEIEKAKKQKDLHSLMEDASLFFHQTLFDSRYKESMTYLEGRNISEELIRSFKLGYAPEDGQLLRKAMLDKGYTEKQMLEAGLISKSKRGTEHYSFFRERIMFPVLDRRGRTVAFGGRILPDHLRMPSRSSFKPPKYMNSSDTPLFDKGRMLYGESHARQACIDGSPVIVVEGYLDVMACYEAGWKGAVAPLGTALTEDQILLLWKMIPDDGKKPILCFDGDEAGRRAAAKACERLMPLLKPNHSALFAFLPEGEDPDSLIRAGGKKAFASILEAAMPMVDFIWNHHTAARSFDTPEERAGLVKILEDEASRIADKTVQQYYRQAFRDKVYKNFSYKKNNQSWKKNVKPNGQGATIKINRPVNSNQILSEKILLATIINHPEIFDQIEDDLNGQSMTNARLDFIRQTIVNKLIAHDDLDAEAVQNHLIEQGMETELRSILSESTYVHAGFARKGTDRQAVLEGWKEVCNALYKRLLNDELKQAGRNLAKSLTKENEDKMMALHGVYNIKEK